MKRSIVTVLAASLALSGCLSSGGSSSSSSSSQSGQSASAGQPVPLRLIALNDFHGNLETPGGTVSVPDPADPSKTIKLTAGGVDTLAAWIKQSRAKVANSLVLSAGDLIGGSPLISGLFHDEPTIEAMNLLGLDLNAVGNHEFDAGQEELLRKQNGGCKPGGGNSTCQNGGKFDGAKFKFLAANVEKADGKTLFAPYEIRNFNGVPMAFIGMTLEGTAGIVSAAGIQGLAFKDEADTVNKLIPELKAKGVQAIAVVVHEGGLQTGTYNGCTGISGAIVDIVNRLDKAVDLVISGHTHRAYNCVIDGRPVTSAFQYGQMFTEIDLKLDPATKDVLPGSVVANNRVATKEITPDSLLTQLVDFYKKAVAPIAGRIVGYAAGPLSRSANGAGESVLGNVVADAQLAATQSQNAVAALMNPGGIRADITPGADGSVTFNQLYTAQPFNNLLVSMTLSGTQLDQLLEQQFTAAQTRILQVSNGFRYSYSASAPFGSKVDIASIRINGQPVSAAGQYRITVNSFLADGGDGFAVLKEGKQRVVGGPDIDALEAYVKPYTAANKLAVPALGRITQLP